jgi:hypothetical protein
LFFSKLGLGITAGLRKWEFFNYQWFIGSIQDQMQGARSGFSLLEDWLADEEDELFTSVIATTVPRSLASLY